MNELKLYRTNNNLLNGCFNTFKMVSDDIRMEFGLDKCAKATFKRGKIVLTEGTQLDRDNVIQELEPEATHTYLGIKEEESTEHNKMKAKIQKQYKRRITLVLKAELNARNEIATINILAVPVVRYSYRVILWKLDDIQGSDKMTRKNLCMNWIHVKRADTYRIYLLYQEGGRRLMNLEKEYKTTMVGLHNNLTEKNDIQITALFKHQGNRLSAQHQRKLRCSWQRQEQ